MFTLVNIVNFVKNFFGSLEGIRSFAPGPRDGYCDLNNLKPFNDQFGCWHGDKMIRLLASVIVSKCDAQRDFAGHMGDDDFVVLFQSTDWESRCERIIRAGADREDYCLQAYLPQEIAEGHDEYAPDPSG
jgi:GGDEF domain-containing protein